MRKDKKSSISHWQIPAVVLLCFVIYLFYNLLLPKIIPRLNIGKASNKFIKKNEYKKAIKSDEMILQILLRKKNPSDKVPIILNRIGISWYHLGEHKNAIRYYEKALVNQHPDVAIVWSNMGMAWTGLGEHKKAIEYYEKALARYLKTYGSEHPKVTSLKGNIRILNKTNRLGH